MNCVLYARVSTDKQADKELSIPAQLQAMRAYAAQRGWTVTEEFLEPGVSARSAERPALGALLHRCRQQPPIQVVLVHKIDRLARSVYDHAAIRAQLRQRQIRLASVVENVDDSVSGQLLENIMASIGEFYSSNLGEETKKGMRMKVERGGWPFKPPRGYKIVHDESGKSRIETDHDADAIRFAHETYASGGCSLNDLRRLLADRGLRTVSGKVLSLSNVTKLLRNPFYAGRVRWHGVEHRGNHPAIVPDDLFQRVQAVLLSRHRDPGEKGRLRFQLRGIARCAECGAKMTAERHDRWSYYRCVRRMSDRRACGAKLCNAQTAHRSLSSLYERLHVDDDFKAAIQARIEMILADRTRRYDRESKSLRTRKTRYEEREVRLSEAFAEGLLSARAYRASLIRVRGQLAGIETSIRSRSATADELRQHATRILTVATSLKTLHDALGERERKRLLGLVFENLLIDQTGIVGFKLNSPFDQLLNDRNDSRRDGPPVRPHLEDASLRAAISSIFEFDLAGLSFLKSAA